VVRAVATHGASFRQGAGRLCLDFVRTLRHRGRPAVNEELADPEALRDWVNQFGVAGPAGTPSLARVRQARRLREAVHELITAARRGAVASDSARELVNRMAAWPVPAPALDPAGRLAWTAGDPVAATLALIARDALDLVGSGAVDRVRACANPDCGALFHDGSRPGRRRWCSMDSCGNQSKKETLRRRTSPG